MKKVGVVILAAGESNRFNVTNNYDSINMKNEINDKCLPKQFCKLLDHRTMLEHSIDKFQKINRINYIQPVVPLKYLNKVQQLKDKVLKPIAGGKTRCESSFLGILSFANFLCKNDYILIHDAARPYVSTDLIENIIDNLMDRLEDFEGVIPCINTTDTIKEIDKNNFVKKTLNRETLKAIQTPQGFIFGSILSAYKKINDNYEKYYDDSSVAEIFGIKIKAINGEVSNRKITYACDIDFHK